MSTAITGRRRRTPQRVPPTACRAARAALVGALLAPLLAAHAVDAPPGAASGAAPSMSAEQIAPGLYRIGGAGAGSVMRIDTQGAILVDANRAGSYEALMGAARAIAKTSDPGIRALVLTAAGADQVGNLAQFVRARIPVIVERRAVAQLRDAARIGGDALAKPFVTYDADYLLRVGNAQAEIEHVGHGRTGADSVVYFRDLRAVAVGELFTHEAPRADCATGGSFAGWAAAIAHLLWFDFDVAVPSRGAPVGKPELLAFRQKLLALASGPTECRRSG